MASLRKCRQRGIGFRIKFWSVLQLLWWDLEIHIIQVCRIQNIEGTYHQWLQVDTNSTTIKSLKIRLKSPLPKPKAVGTSNSKRLWINLNFIFNHLEMLIQRLRPDMSLKSIWPKPYLEWTLNIVFCWKNKMHSKMRKSSNKSFLRLNWIYCVKKS